MRILMLAQFYPPDIGGEERHVYNLSRALVAGGHEVEVVTSALGTTPTSTTDEDGVVVHRVRTTAQRLPLHSDDARPHAAPLPDPAMARAIADLTDRRRFDIAHAHNWIVNSAVSALDRAVPLVLTLHDFSHVCSTKRLMRNEQLCDGPSMACVRCATSHYGLLVGAPTAAANAVSRWRRERRVTRFIAVSNAVAALNRLTAGDVPFEVIPNFVPDELLHVDVVPPSRSSTLLYVGDLALDKGVGVLLDAMDLLPSPPHLQLVGRPTPSTPADMSTNVELTGPVPHARAMELVRAARVLVVPSVCRDACPTVVLEGMAAGRPVVAAASGGIVDLVEDGITGVLVPPGDAARLAGALHDLLVDPERLDAMGAAARRRAAQFAAAHVTGRIGVAYRRAIESSRSA